MRPVNKGNGAAYTANVPVSFDFSHYGKDIRDLFENDFVPKPLSIAAIPVLDCLNFWLQIVKDGIERKPVKKRTQPDRDRLTMKKCILDKVTDVYKTAGIPMVQSIGGFCCYCDTCIPGLLEVEHCSPKSQYPKFSMNWGNFLMSCGPCNNTKRDHPERNIVGSWGIPLPDEDAYQNAIRNRYVWADLYPYPYQYIVPKLYYSNAGVWQEVPPNWAYSLNNIVTSYDLANRIVMATLNDNTGVNPPANVQVEVRIAPVAAPPATQGEVIDLCGLNNPGNTDSTYDRRLVNRTITWFKVLNTLYPFSVIPFDLPTFNLLWSNVLITAASTGFFSVWYIIFKGRFKDPAGIDLGTRFAQESNSQFLFPGTNTTNL